MIAHRSRSRSRSRSRLAQYGARLRTIEGRETVEMVNLNDNARARHQYRRTDDGGLERRTLLADGQPANDGSPWIGYTVHQIASMAGQRGQYHPILDPLGLDSHAVLSMLSRSQ